jgi:hypothetical protein
MFVTTSKSSNILVKRFAKYMTVFLPDIKYIPRGKTPLIKIFENARYLGHVFFLKISPNRTNLLLSIFSFRENTFFLEREYLIEVIDLRHFLTFSEIKSFKDSISDEKKVFYFLDKKYLSSKSDYGIFESEEENVFSFLKKEKALGFKFKILNVKKFD